MRTHTIRILFLLILTNGCNNTMEIKNVVFLHHSIGERIWIGNTNKYVYKIFERSNVEKWITRLNRKSRIRVNISELDFPKREPYGWNNYPYDYYNIWVKNEGNETYRNEPTLEILTQNYDIIIWKHCSPVSNIQPDSSQASIDSDIKTISNYKLQYDALKEKMHQFPNSQFIVWTPTPNAQGGMTYEEAKRTKEFYEWVVNTWDENNDNIYLWDYYQLAAEDGLYLKTDYAVSINDSHPNKEFSGNISEYFSKRIMQVAQGIADNEPLTGK